MKSNKEQKLIVLQKGLVDEFYKYLLICGYKEKEILLHSDIEQEIKSEEIIINWYGNLVGRNNYKDLNTCWLLGTPHMQFSDYVINFVQYAEKSTHRRSKQFHGGKFYNVDLKNIQNTYLAKEMYQSLKRIARNDLPAANFNVVVDDEVIEKILIHMFKGIEVKRSEFDFVIALEQVKEAADELRLKSTKKYKVYDYIINLDSGTYGKSDICHQLDIPTKRFSNYISKNNQLFKPLIDQGKIVIHKYDITVNH